MVVPVLGVRGDGEEARPTAHKGVPGRHRAKVRTDSSAAAYDCSMPEIREPRRSRGVRRRGSRPASTSRATRGWAQTRDWPEVFGDSAILHDVPGGNRGVDIPGPSRLRSTGAELAADAWGAQRSWFLLNGASGGNHAICLALAHARRETQEGPPRSRARRRAAERPLLDDRRARCCRACAIFVAPEIDPDLGVAHCVTPEALAEGLDATPRRSRRCSFRRPTSAPRRASRSSPRSPTPAASRWSSTSPGAPTSTFTPTCPRARCRGGADVVLSSTHKIVGSLTQSAILHLGSGELIDEGARSTAR